MLRGTQCIIQAAASCIWKATGCTEVESHSVARWLQASVTGVIGGSASCPERG